ncbi:MULTISPECIES: AAA family ATPase [unclassified Sporosarcina]|uniref:AAA family ATPase n=1 Tax=unclassified Sporosarcina TaxID=2647733 RepID=UPI000C16F267|nr:MULTISPECIES: AAA family ATPase [unclassified Sporosarcina]PIC99085.1 ATPase [Sporosarcina sp. P29]PID05551.1 ATPase [Sporosarcina sp. P30]PID08745.1 ATPase [Sporosarcina sp. P31]PID11917.1 ATPase [Sporosarcina sp. P32b]
MDTNIKKLHDIKKALNAKFFERENEVEGILVALLSKQHMLMIGPAGTAKSALSVELAKIVNGTSYFQWLLTRFSTPEEVFGPLSLKDLEEGVYKRNTATKMPEAHLVFLDEIFKANSAILNSLLTLINERLFYNDGQPIKAPLMSVIGASNEYPEEGEGLEALFDRFLLRFEINFIADESNFVSMMKDEGEHVEIPTMHLDDLVQLQIMTNKVHIPDEVYETLSTIRRELQDEGIQPSDRRFKQSLGILQARALLYQRESVQTDDMVILENALWETLDQKETVCTIVRRHSQDGVAQRLSTIENEANEIYDSAVRDQSTEAGMEAVQKITVLSKELNDLKEQNSSRSAEVDHVQKVIMTLKNEVESSRMDTAYYSDTNEKKDENGEQHGVFFRM